MKNPLGRVIFGLLVDLPLSIAADAITLGGVMTTGKPYTKEAARRVMDAAKDGTVNE